MFLVKMCILMFLMEICIGVLLLLGRNLVSLLVCMLLLSFVGMMVMNVWVM